MANSPAFQFYPGDWMKDPALRLCSPAARGAWIDILCMMFESGEPGVLITNGRAWTIEQTARVIGADADTVRELIDFGVARVREDGAIYSARMVRDQAVRAARAEAGAAGGKQKPKQTASKTPSKSEANPQANRKQNPKQNDPPSSSSSSSSSSSISSSKNPPTPPAGGTPPAAADGADSSFDAWWKSYPVRSPTTPRGNRKLAFQAWVKLGDEDRAKVVEATRRLVASGQIPKDAERFLRPAHGGGDPPWRAWLDDPGGAKVAAGGTLKLTHNERKEDANVSYNDAWLRGTSAAR